ncbi:MAG: PAS domain S-box protein [Desulfoferrobacter sp.]
MSKKPTYEELERRLKEMERETAERVRAEEALRDSERKFRAIFDQTYQFIGLMTPDGTLMEANRTALGFSGITESEVIGKPFWETPWWIHSKELQERLRKAVKETANGRFVRFEATHVASDGSLRYIDFSLKPVKDEAGNVTLLIPEGRDITDRKLTELALRESEETARALLNAPTDSAILIDPYGKVRAINKIGAERLGKKVDEITGKSIFEFLPPGVAVNGRARLAQVIESGKPMRYEDRREGYFFDVNIYPILDLRGKVSQVAIYARDITGYKLAQAHVQERTADLIESEEKYRTLVENVPLVVYRLGPDRKIVFVNQVVEELFGYRPDEILHNPDLWNTKIYPEDRPRVEELRSRIFKEGNEFVLEYRVRHKNGHIVHVMDHAIPLKADHDLIRSVDGIIMDVTSRVKLQEQLVRAEELKTISEISARLAHEIRNPLVSAGGFARRLLASLSPHDPNRAKVEIIVEEVARLETILRMILSYIQPIDLHLERTNLNLLIVSALNEMKEMVRERNVRLDLHLMSGLPDISVDPVYMEQVLQTLVANALYQMPAGETLVISDSIENKMLRLTIRYRVTHASRDDVEHFFYPFTTTHAGHEIVDLPMAKILVDKHGGLINATITESDELIIHIHLPF